MVLPILAFVFLTELVSSEEVYRIPLMYNGYKVYEDIVLNREKNTMLVITGNLNHIPGPLESTINLHDFNKHVVAIKNVNSGRCTIVQTKETMALADRLIYNITKLHQTYPPNVMHLHRSKTKLGRDEVISMAGQGVVDFCNGYDSFFAVQTKSGVQALRRQASSLDGTDNIQVMCFVHVDQTIGILTERTHHRPDIVDAK